MAQEKAPKTGLTKVQNTPDSLASVVLPSGYTALDQALHHGTGHVRTSPSHRDRAARLRGKTGTPAALASLLDRLALRLGMERIPGIGVADSHLPELAWHAMHPGESAAPIALPSGRRPAWLLHEPRPLVRDAGGLHCCGRLQLLHGPEHIGSGWRHEEARRDYLVARREHDCALCWAFHDRSSRRWFLQVFRLGSALQQPRSHRST